MSPSRSLQSRLLDQIMRMRIMDVHSHVPAAEPVARSLRDLLGYHYYTELVHSAGMSNAALAPQRPDEELMPELAEALSSIDNTIQYKWMMELARELFGFGDERLTASNWQSLDESVRRSACQPGRARQVMDRCNIEKVFLTNEFDEDLSGIDTTLFVPSLRADALVRHMDDPEVRQRLEQSTGMPLRDAQGLAGALGAIVTRFRAAGARSASMSLPPHFQAVGLPCEEFDRAVRKAARNGSLDEGTRQALRAGTLSVLAGLCQDLGMPIQIMYGVIRGAYEHGVYQGHDLLEAGDTLHNLMPLLNAYPGVTFCLSVLSDSQEQELSSFGWLVHNVVLSGHWWYLNLPAQIARHLAARLQAVPKTKLIGYYSDMYKLEFGLPKFNMYRRILAQVLAADFVEQGFGSEDDAVGLAHLLLRENAVRIFGLQGGADERCA